MGADWRGKGACFTRSGRLPALDSYGTKWPTPTSSIIQQTLRPPAPAPRSKNSLDSVESSLEFWKLVEELKKGKWCVFFFLFFFKEGKEKRRPSRVWASADFPNAASGAKCSLHIWPHTKTSTNNNSNNVKSRRLPKERHKERKEGWEGGCKKIQIKIKKYLKCQSEFFFTRTHTTGYKRVEKNH